MTSQQVTALGELVCFFRKLESELNLSRNESALVAQAFPLLVQHGAAEMCEVLDSVESVEDVDDVSKEYPSFMDFRMTHNLMDDIDEDNDEFGQLGMN